MTLYTEYRGLNSPQFQFAQNRRRYRIKHDPKAIIACGTCTWPLVAAGEDLGVRSLAAGEGSPKIDAGARAGTQSRPSHLQLQYRGTHRPSGINSHYDALIWAPGGRLLFTGGCEQRKSIGDRIRFRNFAPTVDHTGTITSLYY